VSVISPVFPEGIFGCKNYDPVFFCPVLTEMAYEGFLDKSDAVANGIPI
jgi:hypothetical protein